MTANLAVVLNDGLTSCIRTIANADAGMRLQVFHNMAKEAAGYVRDGLLEKPDVVDRLIEAAERHHLIAQHGREKVEALLGSALASASDVPVTLVPASLRVALVEDFIAKKLRPRDFVVEPIMPSQGLGMLAAFRGIGKTHAALGIGGAVASGGTFLKWKAPQPRRVLHIDGEMPAADLQSRLRTLPYDCEGRFRVLSMDDQELGTSLNLSKPDDQLRVEAVLGETELLILDNRSTLVNAGRENDADSWIIMQDWLLRLRRGGLSVLLVEHAGRSGDPRGTSKREDVLDTIIQLRRPDDYLADQGARFEVHLTKARGISGEAAKPFEAKLEVRDGQSEWTIRELQDVEADRVRELTSEGMSVRDIAEETGLSKSRVNRIQAKLKAEGSL